MSRSEYADDDQCQQALDQVERPDNFLAWDDRVFRTHFPTITWAERGDDLLAESNYLMIAEHLAAVSVAWADGENRPERPDDVIDSADSHWLVGLLRTLYVCARDENGEFTPSWRAIVAVGHALSNYPVWDESDFSERESKERDRQFADAVWSAACRFDTEDTQEWDQILTAAASDVEDWERFDSGEWPNIDYDAVKAWAIEVRNAHYEALAAPILAVIGAPVVLPGQLPLPL